MKSTLLALTACSVSLFGANALTLENRHGHGLAVFSVPFERTEPVALSVGKRAGDVPVTLNNGALLYTVTLQLGTPPQTLKARIDTGSSFLIVETASSNLCSSIPAVCTIRGSYQANTSSTYEYADSNFKVSYGGGVGATGDDALDILSVGNAVIQHFRFGIQYKTNLRVSIFGISYPSPDRIDGGFANALVAGGYIASMAYSLWLNDDRATSGQLLFGGIDTEKYRGSLVTINLLSYNGVVSDFKISLLDITVTQPDGTTVPVAGGTAPGPALLDSGTTPILLPISIIYSIVAALGGSIDTGTAFAPCSLASTSASVNFILQGITIHVPINQIMFNSGAATDCQLLLGTHPDFVVLGDAALSSMYVVYDMDNNQVSVAPTVFNSHASNILQITTGPNSVPRAPGVPLPVVSTTLSSTSAVLSSSSMPASISSVFSSSSVLKSSSYVLTSSSMPASISSVFSSSSVLKSPSYVLTSSLMPPYTSSVVSSSSALTSTSAVLSSSSISMSTSVAVSSSTIAVSSTVPDSSSTIDSSSSQLSSSTSTMQTSSTLATSTTLRSSTISSSSSEPISSSPSKTSSSSPSSSTIKTTTTRAVVKPATCQKNNCYRAMLHATVTPFCSSYLAGVTPLATPKAVSKGCDGLASRISSACSCLPTAM